MKKYNFRTFGLLCLIMFFTLSSRAQVFEKNKSLISIGAGVVNYMQASINLAYDTLPNSYFHAIGPFFLKYEEPFSDKVTFAVLVSYVSAQAGYINEDSVVSSNPLMYYREDMSWYSYSILARLNWHFLKSTKIDLYLGMGVGFRDALCSFGNKSVSAMPVICPVLMTHLGFELTFGMRYMVTKKFGFYTEVGLAKALIQAGVTIQFPAILSTQ